MGGGERNDSGDYGSAQPRLRYSRGEHAKLACLAHRFGTAAAVERGEGVGDVHLHRARREAQGPGDFFALAITSRSPIVRGCDSGSQALGFPQPTANAKARSD